MTSNPFFRRRLSHLKRSDQSPVTAMFDRRVVHLAPIGVLVGPLHPLAEASAIRPAELASSGLWCPSHGTAPEVLENARHFCAQFAIALDETGINLGLEHLLADLEQRRSRAVLVAMDMTLPPSKLVKRIILQHPTPLFSWSMIWRRDDQDSQLAALRHGLADLGKAQGWLAWDPTRHWLPAPDIVDIERLAKSSSLEGSSVSI